MAKTDKMEFSFISASRIQEEAVSSVTKLDPVKEEGILFGTDLAQPKRRNKAGTLVPFVRIRIGVEAARKAKFEPGMRVDLLLDPVHGVGFIHRLPPDTESGWILAPLRRNANGESPLQLRFTWHKRQPSIAEPALCSDVKISEQGIQFTFPEGTSFGDLVEIKKPRREEKQYAGPFRRSSDRARMNQ